jgi:hypothetical protein
MTNLQMQYANVLENKQHNRNVETEANRHNLEQERLMAEQNEETRRYNQVLERLKEADIATDRYKAALSDTASKRNYALGKESNKLQAIATKYDSWAKVTNAKVNKGNLDVNKFVAQTNAAFKEIDQQIAWFEAHTKDDKARAEIRNMHRDMLIKMQKLQPELDYLAQQTKTSATQADANNARAIKDTAAGVNELFKAFGTLAKTVPGIVASVAG